MPCAEKNILLPYLAGLLCRRFEILLIKNLVIPLLKTKFNGRKVDDIRDERDLKESIVRNIV